MPVIGYGTWRSEPGKVADGVKYALENGYTHIDAAYCYENEKEVGEGIRSSGVPREKIFITSKLWCTHLRPENAKKQLSQILSDLGVSYLDQLLIHWPTPFICTEGDLFPTDDKGHVITDQGVDLKDTWNCMETFVDSGLCRSIGLSNCTKEQVQFFIDNSKIKPAVNQIEVHPYFNNADVISFCKSKGVHVVAYSPLGNFDPTSDHPSAVKDHVIAEMAKKYSKSPAQVILRWHLQNGLTVIPKSVTFSRIAENIDIFDFQLGPEDMMKIQELGSQNFRTCNPRHYPNGQLVWPNDTTVF
jgi:diketogulonate reductase-like aldo/keto reductase